MFIHILPALKLLLALGLSSLIGIERQKSHKPAGTRTHILVCISATLLTIVSIESFPSDTARVAAGVVTGMGFLGAGTIIASGKDVHGLTTAASLWTIAIIGVVIGIGYYTLATLTTILIFIVLLAGRVRPKLRRLKQSF